MNPKAMGQKVENNAYVMIGNHLIFDK